VANDKDIIEEADHDFELAVEAESDNRNWFLEDLRFGRLGEQWPDDIAKDRHADGRPCLTLNHMPAFIRQVVNDCRQNKPAIKVAPVDSGGDIKTAKVFDGIIRNIEQESRADIAYDTAVEFAASGGFGYFRIDIDYAHDDTFDLDIRIERVSNPLAVYGDPASQAADSSDWNNAFIVESISKETFEAMYPDAEPVDFKSGDYAKVNPHWRDGEDVIRAEYWKRKEVQANLLQLSNGEVIKEDIYAKNKDLFDSLGVTVQQQRPVRSWKVCQYIMTGAEVLETNEWASKYIPIVPVYGEELNIEGKRYFRSLIRDAKDAQRMHNYWESVSTELAALQPRVPFTGPKGIFDVDKRWKTANKRSHAYLEFDPKFVATPPQRQVLDSGPAISAIAESKRSVDSMKAIMGLYNASLGERSNETSGVAINSRKVEGEVSTFHFPDNLARAIGHGGRILLDLIPQVYSPGRIVRTLGQDGAARPIQVGNPAERPPGPQLGPQMPGQPTQPQGQEPSPMATPESQDNMTPAIYYLGAGKYDLTVKSGPSFTTRRQEAAAEMTELIRAFPDAAPIIGDILVENLDWPGADKIAERLRSMLPAQAGGGPPPEMVEMIEKGKEELQRLGEENQKLKADSANKQAELQIKQVEAQGDLQIKQAELEIKRVELEMKRAELAMKGQEMRMNLQHAEQDLNLRSRESDLNASNAEREFALKKQIASQPKAKKAN
jgi:hypothetical protein